MDVIGLLPTKQEIDLFKKDKRPDKRAIWSKKLLDREDDLDEAKQREILMPFLSDSFLKDSEAARILGVPLFDPDSDRFAVTASRTAEMESLLPKRVRTREQEINDNF
jgi:hypothetical protein